MVYESGLDAESGVDENADGEEMSVWKAKAESYLLEFSPCFLSFLLSAMETSINFTIVITCHYFAWKAILFADHVTLDNSFKNRFKLCYG